MKVKTISKFRVRGRYVDRAIAKLEAIANVVEG